MSPTKKQVIELNIHITAMIKAYEALLPIIEERQIISAPNMQDIGLVVTLLQSVAFLEHEIARYQAITETAK